MNYGAFQKVKKEWHHGVAFTHMGYNKTLSSENKYMVQESEDEKFLSYREISFNSQILNAHFCISINAGREWIQEMLAKMLFQKPIIYIILFIFLNECTHLNTHTHTQTQIPRKEREREELSFNKVEQLAHD